MPLPKLGKTPCLALAFLLSACRSDLPPRLSIVCIGDGNGGADCVDSTGAKLYKKPSELLNFWMTTQIDEANYTSWCYGEPPSSPVIDAAMNAIQREARAR